MPTLLDKETSERLAKEVHENFKQALAYAKETCRKLDEASREKAEKIYWESKLQEPESIATTEWKRWFAWHPVLVDGKFKWLRFVEKRLVLTNKKVIHEHRINGERK